MAFLFWRHCYGHRSHKETKIMANSALLRLSIDNLLSFFLKRAWSKHLKNGLPTGFRCGKRPELRLSMYRDNGVTNCHVAICMVEVSPLALRRRIIANDKLLGDEVSRRNCTLNVNMLDF